jgi:hypothetical protein
LSHPVQIRELPAGARLYLSAAAALREGIERWRELVSVLRCLGRKFCIVQAAIPHGHGGDALLLRLRSQADDVPRGGRVDALPVRRRADLGGLCRRRTSPYPSQTVDLAYGDNRRRISVMRLIFWMTGLLLLVTLSLVLFLAYLVLVPAARAPVQAELARTGLQSHALTELETNGSLHYVVHLMLGRVLALDPSTRRLADWQYSKARYHSRTPHQLALVTTERPRSVAATISDAVRLSINGLEWLGGRVL